MEERSKRTEITADYVLSTIQETIERCRQAEPVLDSSGDQVTVPTATGEVAALFTFDSKAVLKGCELLGKHLKLFTEKLEHTGKDGAPLGELSEEQMQARYSELKQRIIDEHKETAGHAQD